MALESLKCSVQGAVSGTNAVHMAWQCAGQVGV